MTFACWCSFLGDLFEFWIFTKVVINIKIVLKYLSITLCWRYWSLIFISRYGWVYATKRYFMPIIIIFHFGRSGHDISSWTHNLRCRHRFSLFFKIFATLDNIWDFLLASYNFHSLSLFIRIISFWLHTSTKTTSIRKEIIL